MSDSENEIFEMEDVKMEVKNKPKKEKVKISQERLDILKLQLKDAREAKLKKKEESMKSKSTKKEVVVEEPKVVKERKPRIKKEDKSDILLKEIQSLKLEMSNMRNIPNIPNIPNKAEPPKILPPTITNVSKPINIPQPYKLFKAPMW